MRVAARRSAPTALLLLLSAALPAQDPGEEAAANAVAAANNAFAADLYRTLATRQGSLFFSPYSISTTLAMLCEGACGDTRAEIDRVFHFSEQDRPAAHRALVEALRPGEMAYGWSQRERMIPNFELHAANALWAQRGMAIAQPFTDALADGFGAPLRRLDFRDQAKARAAINAWVAEHTRSQIRDIVPKGLPDPDTRLTLVNAIWFRASWLTHFDEKRTTNAPFTTASGRTVDVPMMYRCASLPYAEDDEVQVAEVPYRGFETSMLVVLPKARDGLPDFEPGLTAERLESLTSVLRGKTVYVRLPRFEVTCSLALTDALATLGMPSAFDPARADLTGMTQEVPLVVSAVLHKAFVKVDETGTEAAAESIMTSGAHPRQPITFTADHPFVFLIRHRKTGAILFLGRYAGPAR